MPCDSVRTTTVDLSKVNPDVLKAAMDALGIGSYTVVKGKVSFVDYSGRVTEQRIKQEYSKQVVLSQAKRFGWAVKTQPDGKLLIQKARL